MEAIFRLDVEPKDISYIHSSLDRMRVLIKKFPREAEFVLGRSKHTVHWYPTQRGAMEAADSLNGDGGSAVAAITPAPISSNTSASFPVFAKDIVVFERDPRTGREVCKGKGGAKSYACVSFAMVKEIIFTSKFRSGGACLYEIIRTCRPCKFHIDADAPERYQTNLYFDGDKMDVIFRQDLRAFLCKVVSDPLFSARRPIDQGGEGKGGKDKVPEAETEADYMIEIERVDASMGIKWSSHYIVQAAFQDNFHVGVLVRMFFKYIIEKYGEPSEVVDTDHGCLKNTNPYFLRKTGTCTNGKMHHCIIDMGIYTSNRVFRSCGCCKAGDPKRVFVHVEPGDTMDTIAKRRVGTNGEVYKPDLRVLVNTMIQDPLFNASWIEHYGKYITAKRSDGAEIRSIGVSRISVFGKEEDAASSYYERLKNRVHVSDSDRGNRSPSLSSSMEKKEGGSKNAEPGEEEDPFFMNIIRNRKEYKSGTNRVLTQRVPISKSASTSPSVTMMEWGPSNTKRRKLNFPADPSATKTIIYNVPSRAEGGQFCKRQVIGEVGEKVSKNFTDMIRVLTRKSISQHSSYYEHGRFMLSSDDFYCNYKKSYHSTGGTYMVLDPGSMILTQRCFKTTCVQGVESSLSKMWPTWDIRQGPILSHNRTPVVAKKEMECSNAWVTAVRCMVQSLHAPRTITHKGQVGLTLVRDIDSITTADIGIIHTELAKYNFPEEKDDVEDMFTAELDYFYSSIYDPNNSFHEKWGGSEHLMEELYMSPISDWESRLSARLTMRNIYGNTLLTPK
jgi:hypothetical protein